MIRCRLAVLLGERKLRVADVARDTGINRSTLSALYYETVKRIDLADVDRLCGYFKCNVGDLFEFAAGESK